MKEEAKRSTDACKSVSQSGRLKKTHVVFTLRQHDAFKVSGEYGCSQYCTVMYCHCLKADLEIIYRVIYSYYYCAQDSDDYTHRKRRERMSQNVIWTVRNRSHWNCHTYADQKKAHDVKMCVCKCVRAVWVKARGSPGYTRYKSVCQQIREKMMMMAQNICQCLSSMEMYSERSGNRGAERKEEKRKGTWSKKHTYE